MTIAVAAASGRNKVVVAAAAAVLTLPVVVPALIVAMLAGGAGGAAACPEGTQPAGPAGELPSSWTGSGDNWQSLSTRQREIAGITIQVGQSMGVQTNGIVSALMAGYQESKYQVYANDGLGGDLEPDQYGIEESMSLPHDAVGTDHGSLGVFQQQWPWWGSMPALMDPQTSAQKFYNALVTKVPNYPRLPAGDVAQTVQVSAYPDAYDQWEPLARELLAHADELGGDIRPIDAPPGTQMPVAQGSQLCGPGAAMTCPPTGLAVEQGLTPDALRVLRCVDERFGRHDYLGVGERSNNPDSDHPSGRAVDVMIADWASKAGNDEGWSIASWLVAHHGGLGVSYVIFDGKIWSADRAGEGWRAYRHPSGGTSPTLAHRDHVHVSVYGNAAGQSQQDLGGGRWVPPIRKGTYTITSMYGSRPDPTGDGMDFHTGVDLAAPYGTPIHAVTGGVVTQAGDSGMGYGNLVVVKTGQVEIYYAHQCGGCIEIRPRQQVQPGQLIGHVGATGNVTGEHLHLEIRVRGQSTDPVPYLADRGLELGG